nr:response regulator [Sphingomonas sp. Y57]
MQGSSNSTRDKATILVVEDELFVRMTAVEAIEDAGYATIEAQDADQALVLLEVHDEIDLVFTDIKMPGTIDGLGLALRVHAGWPGLPLILTSGHLRQEDGTVPDSVPFLRKSYRPVALLAELARLLGQE